MKLTLSLIRQHNAIKRLFLVGLCVYSALNMTVYAQTDQITATFREDLALQLDPNSLQLLSEIGVQRSQLEALVQTVSSYQSGRNESLGIQIRTDLNNSPILKSNPQLRANDLSISPSSLIELAKKYSLTTAQGNQNLESSIERMLSSEGVHSKEVKEFSRAKGEAFQTINPINGDISLDVSQRLGNICQAPNNICDINSVTIAPAELTDSVAASTPNNIPHNLAQCRDSMIEFRRLHISLGSHSAPERLSKDAEIWGAAKNFEEHCLEKSPNVNNVSVIKFTNEGNDPYCGAFRIGPTQFVTAIHCFLKRGRLNSRKAKKSSLYLLDDPDEGIAFHIAQKSIDNFNTLFNGRVPDDEVPALRDFLILNTESFDDKTEADFTSVLSTPVLGRKVLLPGYFAFHSERRNNPSDWSKGIRSTQPLDNDYCKLYDASVSDSGAGCLIHRCQAIGGYSGSPVLQQQPDGKLALVGIHVRGAGNYRKHCPGEFLVNKIAASNSDEPITRFANIAVLARKELLIQSGWNKNGDEL